MFRPFVADMTLLWLPAEGALPYLQQPLINQAPSKPFFVATLPPVFALTLASPQRKLRFTLLAPWPIDECTQPVTMITASALAKILRIPAKMRRTLVARVQLIVHLRRYLLALQLAQFDCFVISAFPDFLFLWRHLNMPANEAFYHPRSRGLLLDFAVPGEYSSPETALRWILAAHEQTAGPRPEAHTPWDQAALEVALRRR